jgi:hypothetical protein
VRRGFRLAWAAAVVSRAQVATAELLALGPQTVIQASLGSAAEVAPATPMAAVVVAVACTAVAAAEVATPTTMPVAVAADRAASRPGSPAPR